MSNRTVFVPVDPEGFGCGLLLGLIIRYWKEILIACLILFGCLFGYGLIQSISEARSARISATQSAIGAATEENRQALVANALSNLRQYRGTISLGSEQFTITKENSTWNRTEFVRVDSLVFSPEGVYVYFTSETSEGGLDSPDDSCLVSNITEGNGPISNWGNSPAIWGYDYRSIDSQYSSDLTSQPNWGAANEMYAHQGYFLYPYSVFPTNGSFGSDTKYYFSHGCTVLTQPIPLFDVLDFSYGETSPQFVVPAATEAPVEPAATQPPAEPAATEAPAYVYSDVISFIYPVDGQTLDFGGSYHFKVTPTEGADGYLWGFFQNGEMVWENMRDEGTLSGTEYGILEGSFAHSKFVPGYVEVWVRASINGAWTEPTIITIYLQQ